MNKTLAANIRATIKAAGFKAKVRVSPGETTWHADDFQLAPDRPTVVDPWAPEEPCKENSTT